MQANANSEGGRAAGGIGLRSGETMADPVTLIVLVAAGEANSATTRAMTRTAHEALGPSSHVAVQETNGDPSDAEALAAEHKEGSDAVVELVWIDARHREVRLRAHLARSRHWLERSIDFRPSDVESERGRTLGFALASILPESEPPSPAPGPTPSQAPESHPTDRSSTSEGSAPPSAPATPETPAPPAPEPATPNATSSPPGAAPVTTAAPAPPPQPKESPPAAHATVPVAPTPPAENTPNPPPQPATEAAPNALGTETAGAAQGGWFETVERPPPSSSHGRRSHVLFDLMAVDAPAISTSNAMGVSASSQWFALEQVSWLSFRLGAGAQFGARITPPGSQEHFNWAAATAYGGVVVHPLRASAGRPIGVEARVDGALMLVWLTQIPTNAHQIRGGNSPQINGGPDAVADVTWLFAPGFEAAVGGGATYAARDGMVTLVGSAGQAAFLPHWRGLFEAGLRVSF